VVLGEEIDLRIPDVRALEYSLLFLVEVEKDDSELMVPVPKSCGVQ